MKVKAHEFNVKTGETKETEIEEPVVPAMNNVTIDFQKLKTVLKNKGIITNMNEVE